MIYTCAGGSGDTGLSDNSVSERGGGLNVVPFLSKERVLDLLLGTLLLAELLVFTDSHRIYLFQNLIKALINLMFCADIKCND